MKIKGLKNRYDFATDIYSFDACMADLAVCKAVNAFSDPIKDTPSDVRNYYCFLLEKFGNDFFCSDYDDFTDYMRSMHPTLISDFVRFLGCLIYLHNCAGELEEVAELLRFVHDKRFEDVSEGLRL